MKRILHVVLLAIVVSVLFTGCNSLILSLGENDYQEIDWKEMETWEAAPDFSKVNDIEKFSDLEGERAFKIHENHSQEPVDLKDFQIGTMLSDGTFIYAYSTSEAGTGDSRKNVHCASMYNYRQQNMTVFHENIYADSSVEDDQESFYIQICNESVPEISDIFVYDNGMGYVYDFEGILKFQTDIETFVRSCFSKSHSVVTSKAITDGNNRIYLQLLIEKEQIDFDSYSTEVLTEEEYDKELEELEKEFEEKTFEILLVYDFQTKQTSMDQTLENVNEQGAKWQEMTSDHGPYTSEPDAAEDWETVRAELPDQWSQIFLYYGTERPLVYKWKDSPVFQYTDDGYVCTFVPDFSDASKYEEVTYVEDQTILDHYYISLDGKYYELYGQVGQFNIAEYENETFTRTYTYQWTETELDEDGKEVQVTKTEERSQTISVPTYRFATLKDEFLEGYYTSAQISQVVGTIGYDVLMVENSLLYRYSQDGTKTPVSIVLEDFLIDVGSNEEATYAVLSYKDKSMIIEWGENDVLPDSKTIDSEVISNAVRISTPNESVIDEKYYEMYREQNKDGISELTFTEHLTADQITPASVLIQNSDLETLKDVGVSMGTDETLRQGYLLTTSSYGLLYYDFVSSKAFCIKDGTWYRTWKQGDHYVSVGFDNLDVSYTEMDAAFARVYKFKINSLFSDLIDALPNDSITNN